MLWGNVVKINSSETLIKHGGPFCPKILYDPLILLPVCGNMVKINSCKTLTKTPPSLFVRRLRATA